MPVAVAAPSPIPSPRKCSGRCGESIAFCFARAQLLVCRHKVEIDSQAASGCRAGSLTWLPDSNPKIFAGGDMVRARSGGDVADLEGRQAAEGHFSSIWNCRLALLY